VAFRYIGIDENENEEVINNFSILIVTIAQTQKVKRGIWIYDRYGEYPAFYGHQR